MRDDDRESQERPIVEGFAHRVEYAVRLCAHVSDVDCLRAATARSASATTSSVLAAFAEEYARPELRPRAPQRVLLSTLCASRSIFFSRGAAVEPIHVIVAECSVANERGNVHCGTRLHRARQHKRQTSDSGNRSRFPSRFIGSGGSPFNRTGAALMPQLPTMTVVTPCEILGNIAGVSITLVSSCVCTSMKPGARQRPSASMICVAPQL